MATATATVSSATRFYMYQDGGEYWSPPEDVLSSSFGQNYLFVRSTTVDTENSEYDYDQLVLAFNVSSVVPAGATINSATLNFYMVDQDTWYQSVMWYNWSNSRVSSEIRVGERDGSGWFTIDMMGNPNADKHIKFYTNESNGAHVYFKNTNVPYITINYTPANTAPYTPSNVVLNKTYYNNGENLTVTWTHSDPEGNSQTQYYLEAYLNDAFNYSTGWVGQSVGNGGTGSYSVAASGLSEGRWKFRVYTHDGTYQSPVSAFTGNGYVDRTGPSCVGGIDGSSNHTTSSGTVRKHTYDWRDNLVGVSYAQAYWMKNSVGVWNGPYSAPAWDSGAPGTEFYYDFPLNQGDGAYTVRFWVYDNAGNGNYIDSSYNVDVTPPTAPTINRSRGDVWGNTNVTFTITNGTDNFAGVNRSEYNINGAGWNTYTGTVTISAEGATAIYARTIDNYGNVGPQSAVTVYIDKTKAADPNPVVSNIKATTVTVSWNALSDPSPSSGWSTTDVYFGEWNGSAYVGTPPYNGGNVGNITSINMTGLKPGTTYRYTVTYHDGAGNESLYTYKTFTTNALPVASIQNLSSSGYLVNQRPKFKITATDGDGDSISNLEIQVSNDPSFPGGNLLVNTTSGGNAAGWSFVSIPSGGTTTYTPQIDLGTGTKYIRIHVYDGKEWGPWSATITFTIQATNYPTAVSNADMGVSKRTIDDLRTKVNAVRQARGLAAFNFADAAITANVTKPRPVHVNELRAAMQDVATALSMGSLNWTATITANSTLRSGQHWNELRNTIITL